VAGPQGTELQLSPVCGACRSHLGQAFHFVAKLASRACRRVTVWLRPSISGMTSGDGRRAVARAIVPPMLTEPAGRATHAVTNDNPDSHRTTTGDAQ
jgi:hypothetical protein